MDTIGRPQLLACAFTLVLVMGSVALADLLGTGGTGVLIAIMFAGAIGALLVVRTLIER